jgi:hypothetical protein
MAKIVSSRTFAHCEDVATTDSVAGAAHAPAQAEEWVMVMFKVTRFCVLPYVRRRGKLERDEVRVFHSHKEAAACAARLRRRCEVVEFYAVTGWPVQDLWDRPQAISEAEPSPSPRRS